MISPIQTRYRDFHFRSRLEARWAVFLDTLKIQWDYEREGYELPSGRYLCDFWLPIVDRPGCGFWLEIKPAFPSDIEQALCAELAVATGHQTYLAYGDFATGLQAIRYSRTGGPPEDGSQYKDAGAGFLLQSLVCRLRPFDAPHWSTAQRAAREARFQGRQGRRQFTKTNPAPSWSPNA